MQGLATCRVLQMEEQNSPEESVYPRDWISHKKPRVRFDLAGYTLSTPEPQPLPDVIRYIHALSEKQVTLLERIGQYSHADEIKFGRLAEEWERATIFLSSLTKIVLHPAYQRIIGMGPAAIPLILREMKKKPGHWLWALDALTNGESPASGSQNLMEATEAWLRWGESRGYLNTGEAR